MHAMRRWMSVCEADRKPLIVRVFHGSNQPTLRLQPGPLWGVRDFGFAASYGVHRHLTTRQAFVHVLDFRFDRLANSAVVDDIAEQLGIDTSQMLISDLPAVERGPGLRLFQHLKQMGYDGITAYDFGFRSDFEELQSWVVFDAAQQATHVSVTPVTKDDLPRTHAPE